MSSAPTRGHEARQRGTLPAKTTARGQVPSHNGHRVPRTREARTTHDEPRHGTRCQRQPGPHARTPPHQQPVGSGPRQPAHRAGSRGGGGRPTPDAPHSGRRRPPRAPSCRPHSAQSRLARARAVGLVMGPHARTPPQSQPVGSGPRQPAQRAGSQGWESARPWTPHTQARGAPPGHPHAAPTPRKSARCGVGDGSPRPQAPAPTASG